MCSIVNISVVKNDINKLVKSMYYTDRIEWIRNCRNITQKELTDYLGIKQQQYARYEKGINIMPITYLAKICEYLDISSDYIIGLTDEELSCPKNKLGVH